MYVKSDQDVNPPAYLIKHGQQVAFDFTPIMPGKAKEETPAR